MFFVSLGAMWQIQTNNRGERASLNWLEERSSEREYAQSAAKFTEQRIRQKIESFHYFFSLFRAMWGIAYNNSREIIFRQKYDFLIKGL